MIEISKVITAFAKSNGDWIRLERVTDGWSGGGITVSIHNQDVLIDAVGVDVERVSLRWALNLPANPRILGDHWERGYGDLEWRNVVAERRLPWYAVIVGADHHFAIGVKTGAASFANWRVDEGGLSLDLDLRNGGTGVQLGARRLKAASIVWKFGVPNAFHAAREICRVMCEKPLKVKEPVYGFNDWYYIYGNNSEQTVLRDSATLSDLASHENRPYSVIDAGWQVNFGCNGGPWDRGNERFPDLPRLAQKMKDLGVRPGIWMRPLYADLKTNESRFLAQHPGKDSPREVLDPSMTENLEQVTQDVARLREWGFELIKHDFSTFDLLGKWGFQMDRDITAGGWHFADRTRTTAEIITALYQAIRDGAKDAVVIGCNTVSHLAAGWVELQRTGDDTSGKQWERTRKMGINTLAYRMPQHETFYECDADCVGLTHQIPWHLNQQWLDLLAHSGTPLFVSASPDALGSEQKKNLRAAFARAAVRGPVAEPMDWMATTTPRIWKTSEGLKTYDWAESGGVLDPAD